jgi:hypothetical protein
MLEKTIILTAFSRGWRALLREKRVTARNIETIASDLLIGILEAADAGEKNEIVLVARGTNYARQRDKLPAPPTPIRSRLN